MLEERLSPAMRSRSASETTTECVLVSLTELPATSTSFGGSVSCGDAAVVPSGSTIALTESLLLGISHLRPIIIITYAYAHSQTFHEKKLAFAWNYVCCGCFLHKFDLLS